MNSASLFPPAACDTSLLASQQRLQQVRAAFFPRLVTWQREHGRHGLPWQQQRDPYRVWLSEVMLQQTQVLTVLHYYTRFLQAFPNVRALADAAQEEVMALWSGLGYYSRARNLHACAQQVRDLHGGAFPRSSAALVTLPGIGPSTAAAIAAFCFGERVSIFDANVQRVLARLLGFGEDLATAAAQRALHDMAQQLVHPDADAAAMVSYTQGLMDLGATVCTARQPHCAACPMTDLCAVAGQDLAVELPRKTKKLRRTAESWWLLVLRSPQGIWLERRPQQGIWAGLHCVPLFGSEAGALAAAQGLGEAQHAPMFRHVLTHKDLYLHPVLIDVAPGQLPALAGEWHADWAARGLPAPLRKWLQAL